MAKKSINPISIIDDSPLELNHMDKIFINNLSEKELFNECINACNKGNLSTLEYILTSNITKHKVSPNQDDNLMIKQSCFFGKLNIVKFLLLDERVNSNINIHAQDDKAFIVSIQMNNPDITKFLILEYNIPMTKNIKKYLDHFSMTQWENVFLTRTLTKKLEQNLALSIEHSTKNSIYKI